MGLNVAVVPQACCGLPIRSMLFLFLLVYFSNSLYTFFMEYISFEDFKKVDIRIGKIISAQKVEDSNKLLKLEVDFTS
ncbi:MAG: hypothetical protein RL235_78, partial [Chlamydiota bacterium]